MAFLRSGITVYKGRISPFKFVKLPDSVFLYLTSVNPLLYFGNYGHRIFPDGDCQKLLWLITVTGGCFSHQKPLTSISIASATKHSDYLFFFSSERLCRTRLKASSVCGVSTKIFNPSEEATDSSLPGTLDRFSIPLLITCEGICKIKAAPTAAKIL